MIRYPYTEILGWSNSRYDRFQLCKRSYYYAYYAKHDTEFGPEKIKFYKSLSTVPLAVGSIAHEILETLFKRWIKSNAPIDMQRLRQKIANETETYVQQNPFAEIHYQSLAELPIAEMTEKVCAYIFDLLASPRMEWVASQSMENRKHWIIEPPGFGETRINGLKTYFKVDFLMPLNSELYIFDWKTGSPDPMKHRNQMLGYALFARHHLQWPIAHIHPILVYRNAQETEVDIQPGDIEAFEDEIREQTREMYAYTQDIDRNIPREKSEFPMTHTLSLCRNCEFRALCNRTETHCTSNPEI
jgi:CRISPR/Cas system-associated exonuclease Cas4 (RecB family)